MPISIIDNFDVNAPKNIDARLGPYDTTANALASIDEVTQRYLGLTVLVTGSGIPTEYWFQDGVTDSDLVLKPIGSAVGFPYSGSDSLNNDPQQALITGSLYLSGSGHITASGDISASGNLFALLEENTNATFVSTYNTLTGKFFYTASNALSTQANTLQQVMDAGSTASVSTDIEIENGGGRLFFDGSDESISITSSGSGGTGAIRLNSWNGTGSPLSASLGVIAGHIYFQGSNLGIPSAGNVLVATNAQGRVKWTGSSAVGASTGSFLTTASAEFSEITFTKGDASTFLVDSTPRRVIETVKNLESFTLPKGTPVYASGSTGNAIHVYAASSSRSDRMPAAYVLNNDLTSGQEGIGILTGFINGVNTSTFASGDVVYVGANGGYTNIKPTGSNLIQNLGKVVVSDAVNGSGVISGAGRSNDVPNITSGYFWVGNSDSVATATPTSSVISDPKYHVYETGSGTDSIKPSHGNGNVSSGLRSTVAGGANNEATNSNTFVGGGELNCARQTHDFIGGGCNNKTVDTAGSFGNAIVGGRLNEILDATGNETYLSFIGGGECNKIDAHLSSIVGGVDNHIDGQFLNPVYSFIGGGFNNYISSSASNIVGGTQNKIHVGATNSSIVGGVSNRISGSGAQLSNYSAILGGCGNVLKHEKSFIIGANLTSTANCTTFMNNAVFEGNISASGYISASNGFIGDGSNITGVVSSSYAVTASHALNVPGGNTQVDTYMYSWQAGTDSTFWNDGNISITYDETNDDIDLVFLTEPSGNGDLVCCTRVFTDGVTPSVDWIDITTQGATYQLAGSIPIGSQVELYIYHVDHPIDTSYPRYKVTVAQDSDSGLYNNNAIVKVYTIK